MKYSKFSEGSEGRGQQKSFAASDSMGPYSKLKFLTNVSDYLTNNQMKCYRGWRHFSSALKKAVRKGNAPMYIM